MGFLNIFKPAAFDAIEKKADQLFDAGEFGPAKQTYEKALQKLEGTNLPQGTQHAGRIQGKIARTREALAQQHVSTALNLIEAGYADDAKELLELARELAPASDLAADIEHLLANRTSAGPAAPFVPLEAVFPSGDGAEWESDDTYFSVLCSTLPDDIREAYEGFGDRFETGFIALNQGDFETAVDFLEQAMEQQTESVTHIHLELATAYLNLDRVEQSRALLEPYIAAFPAEIRAYEMMCEIYWEEQAFKQAEELLSACPDEIKTSIPLMHLMGETLFKSGDHEAAEAFYQNSIRYAGWNEPIATDLARTLEAMGRSEKALAAYGEIMNECKSCRRQVNPFVKQRYAELSFEAGNASSGLIELYFSLCQEDAQNRSHYYRRISDLYAHQGYPEEARRYAGMAEGREER